MKYLKLFESEEKRKYISDFYSWRCSKDVNDPDVVGWTDKESQYGRFDEFNQNIQNGDTVLDYGCGVGDFFGYLKEKEKDVQYFGVDIQPIMIDRSKKKYPDGKFKLCLSINEINQKFDWIVASGVFTVGLDHTDVLNYFQHGSEISNKGVMANFLRGYTHYGDTYITDKIGQKVHGKKLEYSYYHPKNLRDYLEENLGRKLDISSDYNEYDADFTLTLHK